jgi:hypothetical protein
MDDFLFLANSYGATMLLRQGVPSPARFFLRELHNVLATRNGWGGVST